MNDDNVTHIINDKTVGLDQLEGFDSIGQAGPAVTLEIALKEVVRLTAEVAVTEVKRKALWYRLVNSLQNDGLRLGEAQIEADYTMDLAVTAANN